MRTLAAVLCFVLANAGIARAQPVDLRVATFNVEDLRTSDLLGAGSARARQIAAIIQRIRPNVILINEIAYDVPGAPDVPEDAEPGKNARRFADNLLAVSQGEGLDPLRYNVFMGETNTGAASGFDLDKNEEVVTSYPVPPDRSRGALAYGGDAWGFGTFPGQYGMALLVDERLEIDEENIRTFRRLAWASVPGAKLPTDSETGEPWYSEEELAYLRLSSKSHWDVPIKLPNGATVHLLCSHPTPPAFDGPEQRNKKRNHDEIRFWADYLAHAAYIVDDESRPAALPWNASFVILGDLNADPDEGSAIGDPIGMLLEAEGVNAGVVPVSDIEINGLDADDTARFGLRVDYAVPSQDLEVLGSGVWRHGHEAFPSDHFPVWIDVRASEPDP